jgi:hypothetical protein
MNFKWPPRINKGKRDLKDGSQRTEDGGQEKGIDDSVIGGLDDSGKGRDRDQRSEVRSLRSEKTNVQHRTSNEKMPN